MQSLWFYFLKFICRGKKSYGIKGLWAAAVSWRLRSVLLLVQAHLLECHCMWSWELELTEITPPSRGSGFGRRVGQIHKWNWVDVQLMLAVGHGGCSWSCLTPTVGIIRDTDSWVTCWSFWKTRSGILIVLLKDLYELALGLFPKRINWDRKA